MRGHSLCPYHIRQCPGISSNIQPEDVRVLNANAIPRKSVIAILKWDGAGASAVELSRHHGVNENCIHRRKAS